MLYDNNRTNDNLVDNKMTLNGFIYLHTLFIKKGRHETTWTVLKKFGYDRTLSLSREYSSIKYEALFYIIKRLYCINIEIVFDSLKVPSTCSVEFSLKGFEFLQTIFRKYDKDEDGCLNKKELADMFSYCPITVPWGSDVHNTVETNDAMELTYCGFLSQWV